MIYKIYLLIDNHSRSVTIDGESYTLYYPTSEDPVFVTSVYYDSSSLYDNNVVKANDSFLLSNKIIVADEDDVYYTVQSFKSSNLNYDSNHIILKASGGEDLLEGQVRPIVSLKGNVCVDLTSSDSLGTQTEPWKIYTK